MIHKTAEGWWVMDQDINRTKAVEHISHSIEWEPGLIAFAARGIERGKTVVDVGASIGDTAVPFFRMSGYVVAYEPDPTAFKCLDLNCPLAIIYDLALSDKTGKADFTHLLPKSDNWESGRLSKGQDEADFIVQTTTLDLHRHAWPPMPEIGLIKIDVDGPEIHVLRGAKKTIEDVRPNILVEVNHRFLGECGGSWQEIKDFLDEFEYKYTFFPQGNSWESHHSDVLCT